MQQPQSSVNPKQSALNERKRPRKTNPLYTTNYPLGGQASNTQTLFSITSPVFNSKSHTLSNEVQLIDTSNSSTLYQNSIVTGSLAPLQISFSPFITNTPQEGVLDREFVFEHDAEGNIVLISDQTDQMSMNVKCSECGMANGTIESICFRCKKCLINPATTTTTTKKNNLISSYTLRGMPDKNKEVISISSEDEDDKPSPNKILKMDEAETLPNKLISNIEAQSKTSYKIPKKAAVGQPKNSKKRITRSTMEGNLTDTDEKLPLEYSKIKSLLETRVEPDYADEDYIGPIENQVKQSTSNSAYVIVGCRSIRVGSHKDLEKATDKIHKVIFSDIGILFEMHHCRETNKKVKCVIPNKSVMRFYIYPGHKLPVVVLVVGIKCAFHMRKALGMSCDSKDSIYFSPSYEKELGKDSSTKRYILFIPEVNVDMNVPVFRRIFPEVGVVQELKYQTANEFLVIASIGNKVLDNINLPRTIQPAVTKNVVAVKKQLNLKGSPKGNVILYPALPPAALTNDGVLMRYNSDHSTMSMPLYSRDLITLAPESFLNDQIMDLWFLHILDKMTTEEQREKSHIFSTFFYSNLTTTPASKRGKPVDPKLTPAEIRHNRVKKWTKGVDIFEKDFIFIPVNENFHWFLAIICYPGLEGPVNFETGEPVPEELAKVKKVPKGKNTTVVNTELNNVETIDPDVDPNRDEEPADPDEETESELFMSESEESGTEEKIPNLDLVVKNDIRVKQPCILILDSMSGERRARTFATLREYLRIEYKVRKKLDRVFNKDKFPGCTPRVPQQPNHYDCGIYALKFAEMFMQDPITNYRIPIQKLGKWFTRQVVKMKRSQMYNYFVERVKAENPTALKYLPLNVVFPEESGNKKAVTKVKPEVEVNENEAKEETLVPAQEPLEEIIDSSTNSTTNKGVKNNIIRPSSPSLLATSNLNRVENEGEPMEVN